MLKKNDIYFGILNYNTRIEADRCINSLLDAGVERSNIILCQNGDEVSALELNHEISVQNAGFASGVNTLFKYAEKLKALAIVILNPDTTVSKIEWTTCIDSIKKAYIEKTEYIALEIKGVKPYYSSLGTLGLIVPIFRRILDQYVDKRSEVYRFHGAAFIAVSLESKFRKLNDKTFLYYEEELCAIELRKKLPLLNFAKIDHASSIGVNRSMKYYKYRHQFDSLKLCCEAKGYYSIVALNLSLLGVILNFLRDRVRF